MLSLELNSPVQNLAVFTEKEKGESILTFPPEKSDHLVEIIRLEFL
ncbi:hypothetical protein J577_1458 [Acinetobacter sp. 263903-1]|nr:hypothetical protein ACINWCA157_1205 [Acinetobacter radioresistens WC-A-157]EXE13259.1 hypothetical protein J559_2558 [Acinetobacter sp. 983759]KCX37825.1 hypothetical protein J577_1458 [Acinetobacter sp. 263903-1]